MNGDWALVVRRALVAWPRGLVLCCLTIAETALVGVPVSAVVVPIVWPATLLHGAMISVFIWGWLVPGLFCAEFVGRRLLNLHRALIARWCDTRVDEPYQPRPPLQRTEHGWYWNGYDYHKYRLLSRWQQRIRWVQRDPATWRDLCWQLVGPLLGGVPAVLPAGLLVGGLVGLVGGAVGLVTGAPGGLAIAGLTLGVPFVFAGVLSAAPALPLHGRAARLLLAPTERALLRRRVRRLTETRADAVDVQAAELRRIERDLHDGAQARLVAIGLTLGAIEHLLDTDPTAARDLLSRTRQASAQALAELRDLVRGIHPPVLAERGLGDAVRALALDSPLAVTATVALMGRPDAPVESAAYFAIAETLTNVAKHANAASAAVELAHTGTALRIVVTDDGRGGADPTAGTGLTGIRRRLGTFDGTLTIDSPVGGPTRVTMEIPCALSSRRTSTSSEKV